VDSYYSKPSPPFSLA
jgi:hypothetical protein